MSSPGSDAAPAGTRTDPVPGTRRSGHEDGGEAGGEAGGEGGAVGGGDDVAGPSLVRSSGVMALGTLASRVTGLLRTFVLVYAIGTKELGNAYNYANTLPN